MNEFPDIKKANETYGGASDFYKFEEGDNRIRILAIATEPIAKHFIGKKATTCVGIKEGCPLHGENAPKDDKTGKPRSPSIKYMAYIVDREDPSNIRLADLPYSVMKQLADLRQDPDWTFDHLPVPYAVTVKYDSKAAGTDMYKLIPSPTRVQVAGEIMSKLAGMRPLDDLVKAVREKAAAELDHVVTSPANLSPQEEADAALKADIERTEEPDPDAVPF
jgi:hypothetical protein